LYDAIECLFGAVVGFSGIGCGTQMIDVEDFGVRPG